MTEKLYEYDREIFELVKDIDLLQLLRWPKAVLKNYLKDWHKGNPKLPEVEYPRLSFKDQTSRLRQISNNLDVENPLSRYLKSTADSYVLLFRLVENLGKKEVTGLSEELYGLPIDLVPASRASNLRAAEYFLKVCREYDRSGISEDSETLSAEYVRSKLIEKLSEVFSADQISVVVDPDLASKAKTSVSEISLRSGYHFGAYDVDQLVNHEIFVHALTAINGQRQKKFKCLSLDCPRTTEDQEGLATFSEMISGSIDISRMERIALRVAAIDKALSGADLHDIFKFFLESGQNEIESVNSAVRIFRGVPVTGGHAFTKDIVYLKGLMKVHTFFRWALKHQKLNLCQYFFSGRMTVDDVIDLEPCFEEGLISEPKYLPPWIQRIDGLAGYLAFAVFANKIRMSELGEDFDFGEQLQFQE